MIKKNLIEYTKDDRFLLIKFDKSGIDGIIYYKSVEEFKKDVIGIIRNVSGYSGNVDLLTCSFEQAIQSLHQTLNYNESDFRHIPYIIRKGEVYPI